MKKKNEIVTNQVVKIINNIRPDFQHAKTLKATTRYWSDSNSQPLPSRAYSLPPG